MHYNENDFIQIQKSLIKKIVCEDIFNSNNVKTIAGVDLAYWNDSNEQEYAVCCIVTLLFLLQEAIHGMQETLEYRERLSPSKAYGNCDSCFILS